MTLTALREIDPEVYGDRLRYEERGRELIADKRARWLEAVGRLELLGALHPYSEIATLTESVIKRGGVVLIRLDERVGASSELSDTWLKAVPEQHRAALADTQRLGRLVAGVTNTFAQDHRSRCFSTSPSTPWLLSPSAYDWTPPARLRIPHDP